MITTAELRKLAEAVFNPDEFEPGNTSDALNWAANEIDALKNQQPVAWTVPGSTFSSADDVMSHARRLEHLRLGTCTHLHGNFSVALYLAPGAEDQNRDYWTGVADIDAALIMLDRLDVGHDDQTRVNSVAALLRKLAVIKP